MFKNCQVPRTSGLATVAGLICFCLTAALTPASAYRPFDGTDAAVAEKGKIEIEMQPAGLFKDASGTSLIAPAARFNFSLTKTWEAVVEGVIDTPLSPAGPSTLRAAGAFLKGVLREGSLQDKTGLSIATEFGFLLPDSRGDSQLGANLAGIVSQRWDWGLIHFNGVVALSREHRGDVFLGTIVEGPSKWTVRPVAEVFYEREFGKSETVSGLVGFIWQVRDDISFDVGVRHAVTNGHSIKEVRAGVSFSFPMSRPVSMNRRASQ